MPDDVGSIVLQPSKIQDAKLEDTVTGARLPLSLLSDLGFSYAIDLDHTVEPIASLDKRLRPKPRRPARVRATPGV